MKFTIIMTTMQVLQMYRKKEILTENSTMRKLKDFLTIRTMIKSSYESKYMYGMNSNFSLVEVWARCKIHHGNFFDVQQIVVSRPKGQKITLGVMLID